MKNVNGTAHSEDRQEQLRQHSCRVEMVGDIREDHRSAFDTVHMRLQGRSIIHQSFSECLVFSAGKDNDWQTLSPTMVRYDRGDVRQDQSRQHGTPIAVYAEDDSPFRFFHSLLIASVISLLLWSGLVYLLASPASKAFIGA